MLTADTINKSFLKLTHIVEVLFSPRVPIDYLIGNNTALSG